MTVTGPQWEKIFNTFAPLYKDKIIPTGQDMYDTGATDGKQAWNPYQGDLFLNGRAAMTVSGFDYITELTRAKEQNAKNSKVPSVDWGVVTIPQHTENPGYGSSINLSALMGINAKAANADDAWEFISFNNSKEWAKLKSRSTYELIARKSMIKPRDGQDYNVEAFYTLKPVPPTSLDLEKLYREKPGIYEAQYMGTQSLQQVIEGKMTVQQALKDWETKGNEALKRTNDGSGGGIVRPLG
ncbi:multiple sugar transport system substrate-binding protein [Paenibacillus methanolicus]|uniref:Multiple sugar transport system substrate-binding protein n=1 Tax=Paenibacillus methanolicus TaxID=582686 RepID=A0A5S5CFI3_9BACL|nr:multiple sugar transport system substrate-binding protein [Paenibacillus methanolicus]